MRKIKILLVGQPNVGKSSLLNAIVGPKAVISNYPGTTVEMIKAKKRISDVEIEFIDTPGIYSISDRSEEEKITERSLFEEKIDGVIIVVDATSLERSLYIVLQILEAKIPTVVALNFIEDARSKGITIDHKRLESFLNTPVVPINPIKRKGIDELIGKILDLKTSDYFAVRYDDHIENIIEEISSYVKDDRLSKRFVALRVLEGDEDFYKYIKYKNRIKKLRSSIMEHPDIAEDIAITRYGTAAYIAEKVTTIKPIKYRKNVDEKIDNILLHPIAGPLFTILSLVAIFGILLYIGSIIQNYLMGLQDDLLRLVHQGKHSIISTLITDGLTGLAAGVAIALPYVFLFYIILGSMEDVGILSRFIVNAERLFRKVGLPGKAFIPLALGLGCTSAAMTSTRVLSSKKEQFYTASFFSFIPCSSRIAIIMGIVGFYGGAITATAVFLTMILSGMIWGLLIRRIAPVEKEPLLLELPPYRRPLIRNILTKSWMRMKDFVYIVIPLLAVGGVVYGLIEWFKLTDAVVDPFSPVTDWLNLPRVLIIPIIFGFLQKDLTGGMLVSVLGGNVSSLSQLQMYTFGVTTSIGIPCIVALGMLIREFGLVKSLFLTVVSIVYGVIIAGIISNVLSIYV